MSIHCYCTNCTGSGSGFQEMKQIVLEPYTQHRMAIQMPEHRFLTARLEDQLYWHNRQARHTLDNFSLPHCEGGSSKTYSHPGTLGRMPWLQKPAWDCWNGSAVKSACCTVTRSRVQTLTIISNDLQMPMTPAPRDPLLSSGLCRHAHTEAYIHRVKNTNKIKH